MRVLVVFLIICRGTASPSKSVKLQKLAGKVGFDWSDTSDVLVKLKKRLLSLKKLLVKVINRK